MRAAWIAARRAFTDPTDLSAVRPSALSHREAIYLERWAQASGSAFDDLSAWARRIAEYGLYEKTRGYYNPAGRLAEFYGSQVYPGAVAQGDTPLPPGVRDAFPFAPGMDPGLRAAVLQVCQWGNLQTLKDAIPYRGAALGDAGLLDVVDDVEAGKVRWRLWWPGFVKDLDLSPYGDVRGYATEYTAYDKATDQDYTYRTETDQDEIRHYRDGQLWAPSSTEEAARPNPYRARGASTGFVPACWVRHSDTGGPWGEPAMRGFAKVELLNSFVSRTMDYLKVRYKAPYGIAGSFDERGLGTIDASAERQAAMARDAAAVGPEYAPEIVGGGDTDEVFLLALPADASGVPLFGSIDPWQSVQFVDRLFGEIENDNPELSAWTEIRKMNQVSGVAIERALGDTQGRLYRAQTCYDQQFVKAWQMSVAIAGWRANTGAWGPQLSAAQAKFLPYGLESYSQGLLDMALLPRPLAPESPEEMFAAKSAKYGAISAGKLAGLPFERVLVEGGYSEDDAREIAGEAEAAQARALGSAIQARARLVQPFAATDQKQIPATTGGAQNG